MLDDGMDGYSLEEIARQVVRNCETDGASVAIFARAFLSSASSEDLATANPSELASTIRSLWEFGRARRRGRALVRAFNPEPREHPWKTAGTIIEIVNDDMPFLVDSLTAELYRRNLAVHVLVHPIVKVAADRTASEKEILETDTGRAVRRESYIHLRVTELTDDMALRHTVSALRRVLRDVRAAVRDWRAMTRQLTHAVVELTGQGSGLADNEVAESVEFLKWLGENNFTFLGHREYRVTEGSKTLEFEPVARSGLGILRNSTSSVFERLENPNLLPSEVFGSGSLPLILVSKADKRSTVHRDVQLDAILVQQLDENGRMTGQRLFVGLFTSVVYRRPINTIPIVRRKVRKIMTNAGFAADTYDGRALAHVLENLPRDELFQWEPDDLQVAALDILRLQRRRGASLFTRRDTFGRHVSCLVFLPRERFDDALRQKVETVLVSGFGGKVTTAHVHISDDRLARIHYLVGIDPEHGFPDSLEDINAAVVEACRSWIDDLAVELIAAHGEKTGTALFSRYRGAFPPSWRDGTSPSQSVADIANLESVFATGEIRVTLMAAAGEGSSGVRFKAFAPNEPLALSDILPVLENIGFRVQSEVPHKIMSSDGHVAWVHDFGMVGSDMLKDIEADRVKDNFEEVFLRVLAGDVEDDGFNALIVAADLAWRQVVVLRALCSYLRQTGAPFGADGMAGTLSRNGNLARELVALFEAFFKPDARTAADSGKSETDLVRKRIDEALNDVDNPDEDRLLRRLLNLIEATLRTNYFIPAADGGPKPYISFKFDSSAIVDLPLPRPAREIFVYSPRVEGVHCRGGLVARGGIRWSDRRADFRTEILGLMKAQMTKNAVIVPEGSKGGFVVKQLPREGGREAVIREGVACYKTFIRGLLDLTDNLHSGKVVPPEGVVRRDEDDPYLVVAADKGTATFSDIANGISEEYGFWLGDAFASGGSAGYDHKKMGITARGAWECVKRHFREIGVDVQNESFTVVGIGDMSGDVFGNGMLQSRHIRLVGAFNHLHIFVDPDPDPQSSWRERERLFRMPRSSWADYDTGLISGGGGVYSRTAREIPLSDVARQLFGLSATGPLSADEVIRAMLRARVDLLWFGGIGTYVKDRRESHESVGDRGNDTVRVDGHELRCKVVGEGANLAVTQLGRVAYAQRGGHINADFIDNSAGVASSDQEVNIKILLGEVVSSGELALESRNELLEAMTDDVAEHCLMDNYRQGLALSLAQARGSVTIGEHQRFIRRLEIAGDLDRAVEFLPTDEELAERERQGKGLTRPELAVLLAYAKNRFFKHLMESDIPDDPWLVNDLALYFPPLVRDRYRDLMPGHRLQREITATYISNSLINRVGPTFVETISAERGLQPDRIVRAYLICREVFGVSWIWQEIEGLDNRVPADLQTELHLEVLEHITRGTVWFATKLPGDLDVTSVVQAFKPGTSLLAERIDQIVTEPLQDRIAEVEAKFVARGVPAPLARRIAFLDPLYAGCDIVRLANETAMPVADVALAYFTVGGWFGLNALRHKAEAIVAENKWQSAALGTSVDELWDGQALLTGKLIKAAGSASGVTLELAKWDDTEDSRIHGLRQVVNEISQAESLDLAMFPVAASCLRALCAG